ncbi:MAG: flagellar hook-length control protein FliK [Gemmatimonadota bacterium]
MNVKAVDPTIALALPVILNAVVVQPIQISEDQPGSGRENIPLPGASPATGAGVQNRSSGTVLTPLFMKQMMRDIEIPTGSTRKPEGPPSFSAGGETPKVSVPEKVLVTTDAAPSTGTIPPAIVPGAQDPIAGTLRVMSAMIADSNPTGSRAQAPRQAAPPSPIARADASPVLRPQGEPDSVATPQPRDNRTGGEEKRDKEKLTPSPIKADSQPSTASTPVVSQPVSGASPASRLSSSEAVAASASAGAADPAESPVLHRPTDQVTLQFSGEEGLEGSIRVAVRGGILHAAISAAEPAAAARLQESVGELRQALAERGFSDAQISVHRPVTATSAGAEQREPGSNRQRTGDQPADPREHPEHSRERSPRQRRSHKEER